MLAAVRIDAAGTCASVQLKRTRHNGLNYDRRKLYVHFQSVRHGLAIVSIHSVEHFCTSKLQPHPHTFPPPLNSYVYPQHLIVVRVDAAGVPQALAVDEFVEQCAELTQLASSRGEAVEVYDVPAVPLVHEEEEEPHEEEEEEEEENEDAFPDDDAVPSDASDGEWPLDDEEPGP